MNIFISVHQFLQLLRSVFIIKQKQVRACTNLFLLAAWYYLLVSLRLLTYILLILYHLQITFLTIIIHDADEISSFLQVTRIDRLRIVYTY